MNSGSVPHVAIVLAAGGSRRLGRAKQLLTRDGETLVHRAGRLALATRPSRTLLVTGGHGDAVADAVADLGVQIVCNAAWEEGIASSLRAAVLALQGDAAPCLILGCDQPALEHEHLRGLLVGAATASSGCAATSHAASPGVPVVVDAALLRNAHVLAGDRGLRGRLKNLRTGSLFLMHAPELRFDLDTPGDVEEARRQGLIDRL